jgi:hypothetical protein
MTKATFSHFGVLMVTMMVVFQISSCVYEPAELGTATNQDNRILSVELTQGSYSRFMDVDNNSVTGEVDESVGLSGINLNVVISENATISPDPSSITEINGPFNFTVTSLEGVQRIYVVNIDLEVSGPSDDNFIVSFNINTPGGIIQADIDNTTNTINQRISATVDLSNLTVNGSISNNATISPPISSVSDFSNVVSYTVTSETGIARVYEVEITHLNTLITESCTTGSVSKWFGGYDFITSSTSIPFDRNVGTGQTLILDADTMPLDFSVFLDSDFRYYDADTPYDQSLEMRLNIRDDNGFIIGTVNTTVSDTFDGGEVVFDLEALELLLQAGRPYAFQWYVVDGAALGVMTRSKAENSRGGSGFCFQGGQSCQIFVSEGNSPSDEEVWVAHPWNFNIAFRGIQ